VKCASKKQHDCEVGGTGGVEGRGVRMRRGGEMGGKEEVGRLGGGRGMGVKVRVWRVVYGGGGGGGGFRGVMLRGGEKVKQLTNLGGGGALVDAGLGFCGIGGGEDKTHVDPHKFGGRVVVYLEWKGVGDGEGWGDGGGGCCKGKRKARKLASLMGGARRGLGGRDSVSCSFRWGGPLGLGGSAWRGEEGGRDRPNKQVRAAAGSWDNSLLQGWRKSG